MHQTLIKLCALTTVHYIHRGRDTQNLYNVHHPLLKLQATGTEYYSDTNTAQPVLISRYTTCCSVCVSFVLGNSTIQHHHCNHLHQR